MDDRLLRARTLCLGLDVAGFVAAALVCFQVANILVPDNPNEHWGRLAFVMSVTLVTTPILLALYEAKVGNTLGRHLTGLSVVDVRGRELGRLRRFARASIKLGLLFGVVWLALLTDADGYARWPLWAPFAAYLAANAAIIRARTDGRSIVDLLAGTRTTLAR
ncbi:MAG: RDD family protein [Myxococcota bacterium]